MTHGFMATDRTARQVADVGNGGVMLENEIGQAIRVARPVAVAYGLDVGPEHAPSLAA